MKLTLTQNNYCDEWGWYVDIENMNPIIQIKNEIINSGFINKNNKYKNNKNKKKLSVEINKLYTIDEKEEEKNDEIYQEEVKEHDPYDFYLKNKIDMEELILEKNNKILKFVFPFKIKYFVPFKIFTASYVGTLLTLFLTYLIFFVF
jgi:hypothetical protein